MSTTKKKPDSKELDKIHAKWTDPGYMRGTNIKREILLLIGVIDWQVETIEHLKQVNAELYDAANMASLKISRSEVAAFHNMTDELNGKR